MPTIRTCHDADVPAMLAIINEAAQRYRGAVPDDCLGDPYMPAEELAHEIAAGVRFWGAEVDGALAGVMGLQRVGPVDLIRHAYVVTAAQGQGVGGALMGHLMAQASGPVLVGTWAAATWAIDFYRKHGFRQAPPDEAEQLLRRYWTVSDRQIETSVVLVGPVEKAI
ncbi:GNAT family N-acetyltransferase [Caulobacter sp. 1776]|uniref:GNAT family N-acetyltransferase n=1 Tax=Caulobacter sp. 1776 TaxID=3156420 RepID=UPI0033965346